MVDAAVAGEREQCQRLLERARRELEQVQQWVVVVVGSSSSSSGSNSSEA